MIENLDTPAALALVRWLTPEQGGRASGPPTVPVYAANCSFPLGGEAETVPGWPATAEKFSLLLQKIEVAEGGAWLCKIDFLARDLVVDHLVPRSPMLVMEGPKVVGHATIEDVFLSSGDDL
jgi:hypothetical protein